MVVFLDNPLRRLFTRPRKFISNFSLYLPKGAIAADLGCGPGFFTLPISEAVGPEGKVYAVDPNENSIKAIKSKASKHGFQNIEPRLALSAGLEFIDDHSLDFVFANLVLCCMVDHASLIGEVKRTLKPGAVAYLSVSKNPCSGRKTLGT